jgi:hypothetical protein
MKKIINKIQHFFVDSFGMIRSFFILMFMGAVKPRIIYGYRSFQLGKRMCEKRRRLWGARRDQLGKQQCLFPLDDTHLVVLSPLDLKYLQKRKRIRTDINYKKVIRSSYYKTKK